MSTPDSTASSYTLTPLSYTLPLLHAAKNHASTIYGLLLSPLSRSTTNSTAITHAIPLIHAYTSLSPMMEVSLDLADAWAADKGLTVVGLYIGYKEDVVGIDRVGLTVWEGLRRRWEGCFVLVINNEKLAAGHPAYDVYLPPSPSDAEVKPKRLPTPSDNDLPKPLHLSSRTIPKDALRLIREGKIFRDVHDFDDHLEDSRLNWLDDQSIRDSIEKHFV